MSQSTNICPLRTIVANIMNPTLSQPPATRADVICTCNECLMHRQLPWHRRYYPCVDARAVVEPLPRPKEVPDDWSFQTYGPIEGTAFTCRHAKWLESKEGMVKRNTPNIAGYCGIYSRFIDIDALERVYREMHNVLRDTTDSGLVDEEGAGEEKGMAAFGGLRSFTHSTNFARGNSPEERFAREDARMRRDILEDD